MGHSTGCPPDPLVGACVCPTVHPIPRSHGIIGHSMGCPPVPLTDACVSHCPSHPTVSWDHGTFHGMSTCPSYSCMGPYDIPRDVHLTLLQMRVSHCPSPSHDPMRSWDIPWDVHLPSHRNACILLSIPWDHGMSTCPSHRCMCVPLFITSHDPMGSWDISWDVHLSLSQKRVCPTVYPIPRSHGIVGHSMGCPPDPLTDACVPLSIPSHDPMRSWDIPWDVHLSLSQMRVYPPVHPIPRSHEIMGHSMGCPPVPLTDARVSSCLSHPTIPWDHGTFHGMSTCPSHRSACVPLSIQSQVLIGPWDILWDVHLSLSPMHVCPTVHPIRRSHGIVGHFMGCPPVPLTEACVSHCLSHPTVPWDCGTFHGMST